MKRILVKISIIFGVLLLIAGGIWLAIFLNGEEKIKEGYPIEVNGITIPERPVAVCSFSPGVTDSVVSFGAEGQLKYVSDYCTAAAVKDLTRIGSLYHPNLKELAKSLPDLAISIGEPTDAVAERLKIMEIPLLVLPTADSLAQMKINMKSLAFALYGSERGEEKYHEYLQDLDYQMKQCKSIGEKNNVSALWQVEDGIQAATADTLGGSLLSEVGFQNAATGSDFTWEETQLPQGDYRIIVVDELLWNRFSAEKQKMLEESSDKVIFFTEELLERQSKDLTDLYHDLYLQLIKLGAAA